MLERLAGLGPQQQLKLLLDEPTSSPEISAVVLELAGHVAERDDVTHPTAADDVEDDHVLGKADGVIQRQDHRGRQDRQCCRATRQSGGEHKR
jgi:hypothetical protein